MDQQHDDHIWMVVAGGPWAIRSIERRAKTITFNLWRGYAPDLEYTCFEMHDPDWEAYCETAVAMLNEHWAGLA
jgi:hypothetical protein